MNFTKQMAKQFREVALNGTWVATNLKTQITDVTFEQATTKIGSLNTIAALSYHINYYVAGVANVLEGGTLDIRDKFSFDLPPINSEKDWQKLKDQIWSDCERFANAIESMPDEKLDDVFVKEQYGTYFMNIHTIIQHSFYHLGQVVLVKKMVLEGSK